MQGKLIVLEGVDSVGKSTIATLLSEWLSKQGIDNIITRHPGSTPIGKELRKIVKSNSMPAIADGLLMAADNNIFIETILKKALDEGKWVIGDRNNFISSMMYQIQSGTSWEDLDKIHAATHPNPPKIDILFILRASASDRSLRKRLKSGSDQEFNEKGMSDKFEDNQSYNDEVTRAYERLMEEQSERLMKFVQTTVEFNDPPTPCVLYIDASQPLGVVLDSITETIKALLFPVDNNV